MKILYLGADEIVKTMLSRQGIISMEAQIDTVEDLCAWLEEDQSLNACLCDFSRFQSFGKFAVRMIREEKLAIPFVGIDRHEDDDMRSWNDIRADFLEQGGDDLLLSPGNPREVAATLRAIERRASNRREAVDFYRLTNGEVTISINLPGQVFKINDQFLHLTGREQLLLCQLASKPNIVFSKESLLEHICTEGIDDMPEIKIIDVFICKLRAKLDDAQENGGKLIETVWGRGYKFSGQREGAEKAIAA